MPGVQWQRYLREVGFEEIGEKVTALHLWWEVFDVVDRIQIIQTWLVQLRSAIGSSPFLLRGHQVPISTEHKHDTVSANFLDPFEFSQFLLTFKKIDQSSKNFCRKHTASRYVRTTQETDNIESN